MAAKNSGGASAVIPWIALVVVTVFAFGQLRQRNAALRRATQAEDEARALEQFAPAASPARGAVPEITDRERKLDEALLAAQEVTRGDTRRIARLEVERDRARGEADRAAATRAAETARANAAAERAAAAETQAAEEATRSAELKARLDEVRLKHLSDLSAIQGELSELKNAAALIQREGAQRLETFERKLAAERKAHTQDVTQLQQALQETNERSNQLAIARTTAESALAQAKSDLAAVQAEKARIEHEYRQAHQAYLDEGANQKRRLAAAETERESARNALGTLRKRILETTTAQLASEDPSYLVTGARVVGLLRLRGFTARLLELTDHESGLVRAAAGRGLARAGDLERVPLEASDAALALLADDSIRARMAGKDLLAAATGKKIEFDPAAPAEKRAAALQALRRRLGS